MELDEIREALFTDMENQRQADIAANNNNQLLGQQKIMYNNDARGTLYSGQPTWEYGQLATQGITNLADINNKYMSKKLDVWNNITKVLDQIESYNKSAAALAKATNNAATSSGNTAPSILEVYNGLKGGE